MQATGGHGLMLPPAQRVGMLVVGSARQSLQWIAANADGWATYHGGEARKKGRIGLWQSALLKRAGGQAKTFVQSVHLDLLESPDAPAEPLELGLRAGRHALIAYLLQRERAGVGHVTLHLAASARPALEIIDEIGLDVLPGLKTASPALPATSTKD